MNSALPPRALPPRPDERGEPRPPAAPRWSWSDPHPTETAEGFGDPPPGRGPILETHRVKRRHVAGGTAVLCLLLTAYAQFATDLVWYRDPVFWSIQAGIVGYMTLSGGWNTRLAAGSDWLRVRRSWVDTYRLTKITMRGPFFGWLLRMRDAEGRRVRIHPEDVEANRELWALVYNGMVHSVAGGARVNGVATGALRLHLLDPEELGLRRISHRTALFATAAPVAAVALVGVVEPDWLGPALAIFAVLFLGVLLPAALIWSGVVRRRIRSSRGPRKNRRGAKHRG